MEVSKANHGKVIMESPEDEDADSTDGLVIGKTAGSGLKISVLKFGLAELKDLPEDIWVYDSKLVLTLKPESEGSDPWKAQITKIHPISRSWATISTTTGQLTSEQNLNAETGSFDETTRQPMSERQVVADFTDTIQKWISPYDKDHNEPNHGIALVNEYSDGSSENTDAVNIKYYAYANESSTDSEFVPYIDICYKQVEVKQCGNDSSAVFLDVDMSVLLVDDGDNHNNESLSVGTDLDGKKKRFLIKFNLDKLNTGSMFDPSNIGETFLHLHFLDYTDGTEDQRANRTINVYQVTENWKEESAKWTSVSAGDSPIGTEEFEEERLGGTKYTIELDRTVVRDWADQMQQNYGILVVDDNEELASRIPIFSDNTNEDEEGFKPKLEVCIPSITPTTKPTTSTTQPSGHTTETQATVTTKPVFNAEFCTYKEFDPEKPIIPDPNDNTTLCVSTEPMKLRICVDETNSCKKRQMRTASGELVTECNCCQPILKTETRTFDCTREDGTKFTEELEIKRIAACQCGTCENTIYVAHTYQKRSALGFSPSGLL